MLKFKNVSRGSTTLATLVAASIISVGCNGTGFDGLTKKRKAAEVTQQPQVQAPQQQQIPAPPVTSKPSGVPGIGTGGVPVVPSLQSPTQKYPSSPTQQTPINPVQQKPAPINPIQMPIKY